MAATEGGGGLGGQTGRSWRGYLCSGSLVLKWLLIIGLSWCWQHYSHRLVNPKQLPLIQVRRQELAMKILSEGRVHAFETVTVGAQVSGQLQVLHVKLGDYVQKGQLLAEIDPTIQQNNLLACQAQIRNIEKRIDGAVAQLQFSKKEFQRNQVLVSKKLISDSAFEEVRAQYLVNKSAVDALRAELDKAQVELATAQVNLGYTKIVAPISGVVSDVITKEGQTVVSTQSASSILVLQDLTRVTIKAKLPEAQVAQVRPGQEVYFTTIGQAGYSPYKSVMRMVELAPTSGDPDNFSDEAVYYFGLFEVDNAQNQLKPGMTVEVSVVLDKVADALVLPIGALGTQLASDRYLVTVLTPWRYLVHRVVTIGSADSDYVQIKEGLNEGDVVVMCDSAEDGAELLNGSGSATAGGKSTGAGDAIKQRNARKFRRAL